MTVNEQKRDLMAKALRIRRDAQELDAQQMDRVVALLKEEQRLHQRADWIKTLHPMERTLVLLDDELERLGVAHERFTPSPVVDDGHAHSLRALSARRTNSESAVYD